MIVEAAFLKLPELLETSAGSRQVREATVVHSMATAVLMELNARNIEHPTQHVVVEKPFGDSGHAASYSADLYVHLSGAVSRPELVAGYGYREHCWLEAKAFLTPAGGLSPVRRRSEDIGRIVRDILRVCIFPEELQGAFRQNARYLLIVSTPDPTAFWKRHPMRAWVGGFTLPGEHKIKIPVRSLNPSALQAIGGVHCKAQVPTIRLVVSNIAFGPYLTEARGFSRYWGSLSRIIEFKIHTGSWCVNFVDRAGARWDRNQNRQLQRAREDVAMLFAGRAT